MKSVDKQPNQIIGLLLCFLMLIPVSFAETYTYDAAGRLTGVTYADGSGISYSYDKNGNLLSKTIAPIGSADTTPPVITLNGTSPITVAQGSIYNDAGATAADNVDGNITANIVVANTVNTAIVGTYAVTYDVSDVAGNAAAQVTRTVNVTDQTAPVITLLGTSPLTIAQGSVYTDAGATAADNNDGDITASIVTGGTFVNSSTVGTFTITYDVTDAAGNTATQVVRTITVTATSTGDDSGTDTGTDTDTKAAGGSGSGCIAPTTSGLGLLSMVVLLLGGLAVRRKRQI